MRRVVELIRFADEELSDIEKYMLMAEKSADDAELRGMYENLARQEGDHLSALAAQAERLLWADGTITTECRDFLIELLAQHKQKAKALKEQLR